MNGWAKSAFALAMATALGCGGGGQAGRSDASEFTTASRLQQLVEREAPAFDEATETAIVRSWTFVGPRERIGFEPVPVAVGGFTPIPGRVHTAGLQCVAQQVAAFRVADGGSPPRELLDVWGRWCGASTHSGGWTASCGETNQRRDIVTPLRDQLARAAGAYGVAEAIGDDGDLCVAAYMGSATVQLDPMPAAVGGDEVELTGTITTAVGRLQAMSTLGLFGAADCNVDENVALPRFRVRCPLDPGDDSAVVSIAFAAPGRVLMEDGLAVRVSPSGAAISAWELRSIDSAFDGDFAQQFVAQVNRWRVSHGAAALEYDPGQSAAASMASPHWFGGALSPRERDEVALGLLAGWNVAAAISRGGVQSVWASNESTPADAVALLLEEPFARALLLDESVDVLALAAKEYTEGGARSLLLLGYEAVTPTEAIALEARFRAELDAQRAARGLSASGRINAAGDAFVRAAVGAYAGGDVDDDTAMNRAAQQVVDATRRATGVQLYTGMNRDLEGLLIPESMLVAPDLGVSITVGIVDEPDEAWASYAILVVYP